MYAYFVFDNYTLMCMCVPLLTHMWCVLATNSQKSYAIIPRICVPLLINMWCDSGRTHLQSIDHSTLMCTRVPWLMHVCRDSCMCHVTHEDVISLKENQLTVYRWFFFGKTHSYSLVCHGSYVVCRICDSLIYACVPWLICHMTYLAESHMGWLRLVGSIKLQVSFAGYSLFHRSLLQKRPIKETVFCKRDL